MKSCEEVMITLATRKDLSPGQEQQLRIHLAECSTCTARSQAEELTTRTLRLLRTPASSMVERVVDNTDQRIERALAPGSRWNPIRQRSGLTLVGALLALVLLVIAVLTNVLQDSPNGRTGGPAVQTPASSAAATLAQEQGVALPTHLPDPNQTPQGEQQPGAPATQEDAENEQAVRQVVEQFGKQLQLVSTLAPPEVLGPTMRQHYGSFVAPEAIERWLQAPLQAPGRQTSSPWPDRIEIVALERTGEGQYLVHGALVEVTSTEAASNEVFSRIPVRLTVERHEGRWLITDYQAEPDSQGAAAGGEAEALAAHTVLFYYSAINQQLYDIAYRYWANNGAASGQSLSEFQAGYQQTVRVSVILDAIRRPTADAQSVEVATRILAVVDDPSVAETGQRLQVFSGTYTLEPAGKGEQGLADWLIAGADIQEISAALPPEEFQSAQQTLATYYEAINQQDYALAYSAWDQLGQASGQTFPQFRAGLADTSEVSVEQGAAQTNAGAGSIYARIRVVVVATQSDGSTQAYCGFYDLQRANLPPFDQLGWRIQKAELAAIDLVSLNSTESRRLLDEGCAAR